MLASASSKRSVVEFVELNAYDNMESGDSKQSEDKDVLAIKKKIASNMMDT